MLPMRYDNRKNLYYIKHNSLIFGKKFFSYLVGNMCKKLKVLKDYKKIRINIRLFFRMSPVNFLQTFDIFLLALKREFQKTRSHASEINRARARAQKL